MTNSTIHSSLFPSDIWNTVVDESSADLYLELREEESEAVRIVQLKIPEHKIQALSLDLNWWNKLIAADQQKLYFVEYQDRKDPNEHSLFTYNIESLKKEPIDYLPNLNEQTIHPFVYEIGSDYHQTVSRFLSLEQPLSCEYMEWDDKIIISYYVRSDNYFDRYLLLLCDGKKIWKVKQDEEMKGFSLGAFFVFDNQLIFIKNRNEVCTYTG